jgi:ubiquinol-cytochrome c reductase subunit 8
MGGPTQKGIVQYCKSDPTRLSPDITLTDLALSPWKQRAFAGALRGYLFNGYSRIMKQVPYMAIPVATGKLSLAVVPARVCREAARF